MLSLLIRYVTAVGSSALVVITCKYFVLFAYIRNKFQRFGRMPSVKCDLITNSGSLPSE